MPNPSDKSNFIAQGGYGCVYQPHIQSGTYLTTTRIPKKANTIGKIFTSKNEFETEIRNQEFITINFDKDYKYTLPLYGASIINGNTLLKSEASRCSFLKNQGYVIAYQIIYKYGGKSLNTLQFSFFDIFNEFNNLLKGIYKINQNKYVHLDIKPSNILYDHRTKKISLIDFGLLLKENLIYQKSNKHLLSHHYEYYPPEFMIAVRHFETNILNLNVLFMNIDRNYIKFYNSFSKVIDRLKDKSKLFDFMILHFSPRNRNKAIYNSKLIFQENIKQGVSLNQILFEYSATKIDVYMLGMTWLSEIEKELKNKEAIIHNIDLWISILNLVRKMIDPNIFTRYSMKNVIKHYQHLKLSIYDEKVIQRIGKLQLDQLVHFGKQMNFRNISRLNKNELILFILEQNISLDLLPKPKACKKINQIRDHVSGRCRNK